jgi:hypothetical protein
MGLHAGGVLAVLWCRLLCLEWLHAAMYCRHCCEGRGWGVLDGRGIEVFKEFYEAETKHRKLTWVYMQVGF